jgi:hypothetical protein
MIRKLSVIAWILLLCAIIGGAASSQEKRLEFTISESPWTLTIPADDFHVAAEKMRADGRGAYFHLIDEKQKIDLSMFIEPVKDCKDSKSCRDMLWKLGNPAWVNPQNVVQSDIGDTSVLEFLMPSYQGFVIRQQNVYAEFVRDGFWVDMHLSKVFYQPEDHALFERIIKSIKFEPKKNFKS